MTNHNRRITFPLLGLALAAGAVAHGAAAADPAWGAAWKKQIPQSSSFYDLADRGESFSICDGARQFNRGIKRDDTILVTGDRARFAMLRILPEDTVMPDFQKFGDGRVQITCQGQKYWLDLMKADTRQLW